MNTSKITQFATLLLFGFLSFNLSAQKEGPAKLKNWRLELEPASFALKGIAGSISYTVSEDENFSLGLFGASLDIPNRVKQNMFSHVGDTTSVRLGFELAAMARYRIKVFKQMESNPYVGLILGWEYFDIKQPSLAEEVRLSTFLVTPYLGYEIYFFRQMAYVNPQVRSVFYLSPTSSIPSRNEALKSLFILPQVSVGLRF